MLHQNGASVFAASQIGALAGPPRAAIILRTGYSMAGPAMCYTPAHPIRAAVSQPARDLSRLFSGLNGQGKNIMKGPQDFLNQLQGQFGQFVPDMARAAREDFETQARATVMSVLSRLELVTREEFDAQQAVLMKTREKVDALEKRVAELETHLSEK